MSNLRKIRLVGLELFHTDGQKQIRDDANRRFPQICELP